MVDNLSYKITKDGVLSEDHVYETYKSLNGTVTDYASKWEWNRKTVEGVIKYNINPFLKYTCTKDPVLVYGCRAGRDLKLLENKGIRCIGLSFAHGLLSEAKRRHPAGIFQYGYQDVLPFPRHTFGAVYADNISIISHRKLPKILNDLNVILKPRGCMYISVKVHKSGGLLEVDENGAKRYAALFRKEVIDQFISKLGYEIKWQEISEHTEPELPHWYSLVLEKK